MRIVVSGDYQRPSPQTGNILWLYNLIKGQISMLSGVNAEVRASGNVLTKKKWLEQQKNLPTDYCMHHFLKEYDCKNTLHIFFEGPHLFKHQAKEAGARYIDVWVHPVRFLDDLVLGVRSNFLDLSKFAVSRDQITFEAGLVSAAMAHVPGIACKSNSVVIVGQTPQDKSVLLNGEFCELNDFVEEFKKEVEGFDQVWYKPHPFEMAKDNSHIHYFLTQMGLNGDNFAHANSYRLLAEPNITKFVGMSSSLLHEAEYFGKKSKTLLHPWWDGLVPISAKTFLSFDFWRHCLSPVVGVREDNPPIEIPHYHSMLRKLAKSYWGYDSVDK